MAARLCLALARFRCAEVAPRECGVGATETWLAYLRSEGDAAAVELAGWMAAGLEDAKAMFLTACFWRRVGAWRSMHRAL
jgi:hypothetical protein